MHDLQWHPAAKLFPVLADKELKDLAADIQAHGLQEPLKLYQGQILDGRNRYLACRAVGIAPAVVHLPEELNPWDYVWSENAQRRHLEPGRKAIIRLFLREFSAQWHDAQQRRQDVANRKRREAAAQRARSAQGTFAPGRVSPDTRPTDLEPVRRIGNAPSSLARPGSLRPQPAARSRSTASGATWPRKSRPGRSRLSKPAG